MKAATLHGLLTNIPLDISIHAAREGGDSSSLQNCALVFISIHAAREGGDQVSAIDVLNAVISIHAAREGGDGQRTITKACHRDFNPRRP